MAGQSETKTQQNPQLQAPPMGAWGAPVGRPVGFVMHFCIALAGRVAEVSWVFRSPRWIPESVWQNPVIYLNQRFFCSEIKVFCFFGAKALDFGAKASGFPCRELEGRSPSKVAGRVGGGSPPPIVPASSLDTSSVCVCVCISEEFKSIRSNEPTEPTFFM